MQTRDTLYKLKRSEVKPFHFDENVAQVFPDMAERSIPFYHEVHQLLSGIIANKYTARGVIYDLGCSTGRAIYHIQKKLASKDLKVIGVDYSESMCKIARENIQRYNLLGEVDIIQGDIQDVEFKNAELILLNYILQFIPLPNKQSVLDNIYQALPEKGTLLISEKIKQSDEQTQGLYTDFYHQFKRNNGYTELEIEQKKIALENILIPVTFTELEKMLKLSGFKNVSVIFQWFNFITILAEK